MYAVILREILYCSILNDLYNINKTKRNEVFNRSEKSSLHRTISTNTNSFRMI